MKKLTLALSAALIAISVPALAADVEAGKQKATACVLCHGNDTFSGIFFTLQLGGRNADKLTVKTNKYRSLKILHPIMNLVTIPLTDKDVEDISAYYQALGKPALVSPLFQIKGDEEPVSAAPQAPAQVAAAAQ